MDKGDIATLLALASAYDQRTIGETDVEAWFASAEVGRWNFPATRRVIVEHYSRDADRPRITPAIVSDRLRKLRGAAAESLELPRLPAELANADYPTWLREQLADHVDHALTRWAETGEEPNRSQPAVMGNSLAELIAAAPDHVRAELETAQRQIGRKRA